MFGSIDIGMAKISRVDVRPPETIYNGKSLPSLVDYNSWIESDKALKMASKLSKDAIIVEGTRADLPMLSLLC